MSYYFYSIETLLQHKNAPSSSYVYLVLALTALVKQHMEKRRRSSGQDVRSTSSDAVAGNRVDSSGSYGISGNSCKSNSAGCSRYDPGDTVPLFNCVDTMMESTRPPDVGELAGLVRQKGQVETNISRYSIVYYIE